MGSVQDLPYAKKNGSISVRIADEQVLLVFPCDFAKGVKLAVLLTLYNALHSLLKETDFYIGQRGNPVIKIPLRAAQVAETDAVRRTEEKFADILTKTKEKDTV